VQSIENEIFMKLIELFFSGAISEKSKQSGDIITEDKFLKCINEIKDWFLRRSGLLIPDRTENISC
jgi:hypothetical protein